MACSIHQIAFSSGGLSCSLTREPNLVAAAKYSGVSITRRMAENNLSSVSVAKGTARPKPRRSAKPAFTGWSPKTGVITCN